MFDYTTIDFETANSHRGSPCSVGLVRVRNGVAVDERHWLMRPPEAVDHFSTFNTALHGITADMVVSAPRWREVLPAILDFIDNDIVVAHNAGFDIGVLRHACALDDIAWPDIRFLCTMVLARRALPLPSYRLPYVVEALGGPAVNHHDALADARGVVDIVRGLAALSECRDLVELAESVGVTIGHMTAGQLARNAPHQSSIQSVLVGSDPSNQADADGYLYGRVVVFTGALLSMTRQVAWDECARVGATAEKSTTKRTNVLVVGDINPAILRPGSQVTGKARRAFELQEGGQSIEVMTEIDFLRCLDGKPLEQPESLLADAAAEAESARSTPSKYRGIPLEQRPQPQPPRPSTPPKPPRPLRRSVVATDQICSHEACSSTAVFKTRSKPTWCEHHIIDHQRRGGLKALETFTHPDDWQLTECLRCTVQAHYRFAYTLDKNTYGEMTCRACFWREWAAESRKLLGAAAFTSPVSVDDARKLADEHDHDYLGPLTAPSLPDDPHHVRCRRCARISAQRLSDIASGCSSCKHR
ncbi:exonuclease domain-containing protein [Rhodococcus sovatensis]|uniref:Exonuclease domain-containing protein n=1 Tax=Rhodococcus sovatensis TaxID=1805840 RepID=A0ABZ2PMU7_9NOCA